MNNDKFALIVGWTILVLSALVIVAFIAQLIFTKQYQVLYCVVLGFGAYIYVKLAFKYKRTRWNGK